MVSNPGVHGSGRTQNVRKLRTLSMRMRALQNWTEAVSEASSHPNIFSQLANLSVGFWKLKMVQASKDLIRDDLIYLSRNVQSYPISKPLALIWFTPNTRMFYHHEPSNCINCAALCMLYVSFCLGPLACFLLPSKSFWPSNDLLI